MSVNYFKVQFTSQLGVGANAYHNDCGAASWKMCASQYRNDLPNVDTIFKSLQSHDGYLSVAQLLQVSRNYNIISNARVATDIDSFNKVLQKYAVVGLINQGSYLKLVPNFPRKDFKGAHFVTVGGYTQDGYAIFNPYQSPETFTGPDIIKYEDWFQMWDDNDLQGNPNRMYITFEGYVEPNISSTPRKGVVLANGLNIRRGPGTEYTKTGQYLLANERFDILETKNDTSGNPWGRIDTDKWVCIRFGNNLYVRVS